MSTAMYTLDYYQSGWRHRKRFHTLNDAIRWAGQEWAESRITIHALTGPVAMQWDWSRVIRDYNTLLQAETRTKGKKAA